MGKLRIGISGVSRGKHLCKEFMKIENVEVVAAMDPDEHALDKFNRQYTTIKRFTDYESLLDYGIDIVVIASPMQYHAQQSIAALKRNVHVLSEVTAATTLEECKELFRAAKHSKAQYMMAENYCYIRENVVIRNMVEAGVFGEIYFAEGEYVHGVPDLHYDDNGNPTWRRKFQMGKRGCTYGTHSLGPPLQWLNDRVSVVNCMGSGTHTVEGYENDDTIIMMCHTDTGALIKVRLDMISNRPHNMRYYSLQGTKGCYEAPKIRGDEHKVWLKDYAKGDQEWLSLSELYNEFLPKEWSEFSDDIGNSGHWGSDFFMVKDFVEAIRGNRPVPIGIDQALQFTLPGIMSEQSIEKAGSPIHVPNIQDW